jgi:hypothetical protein
LEIGSFCLSINAYFSRIANFGTVHIVIASKVDSTKALPKSNQMNMAYIELERDIGGGLQ